MYNRPARFKRAAGVEQYRLRTQLHAEGGLNNQTFCRRGHKHTAIESGTSIGRRSPVVGVFTGIGGHT